MADMTDLFTAAMNGGVATPTTVAEERSAGTPTLVGTALTNWPTTGASGADSAVFFITAPTTTDKGGDTVLDNTKLMLWKAIVSGNILTNLSLEYSATGEDIGNSVGDVIQMAPTSAWAQAIYQGLTTTVFNNDGSLQDSIIGTDQIQDSAITTDTLAESAVLPPNWSNPYGFSVYREASYNFTDVFTALVFDTKVFDISSNYSTSTGKFTAPATGLYQFNWGASSDAEGETYQADLYQNGEAALKGGYAFISNSPYQGTGGGSTGGGLLSMQEGDTASIYIFSDGTHAGVVGLSKNYFTGYLVTLI